METKAWSHEVDVLVVGSGAGGLTAALAAAEGGAQVLVLEKSSEFGGTSATSGGGVWIPNSDEAKAAGLDDSEEEAFTYVRKQTAPNVPDSKIWAYIKNGPKMLRWVQAHSPVGFISQPYPDYHVEYEGGKPGYRTHLPAAFDGRKLGKDIARLRSTSPVSSLFGRINWHFDEIYRLLFRSKGWQWTVARMLWRYYGDLPFRLSSKKDRALACGMALIGGLYVALKERNVPLWLDAPLVRLVRENGAVTGAIVQRAGVEHAIRARRGVILAAGGFEHDPVMRRKFLPESPETGLSGSQTNNTGDAIRAAAEVGAALTNMNSCWAAPVFRIPGEDRARPSFVERSLPGTIIVDREGHRYLNEAASYHIVGQQMIAHNRTGEASWFLFDANYRFKYPAGPLYPLVPDALHSRNVRSVLKKAPSIEALAQKIGVPASALTETVREFNADARKGVDTRFRRGEAAYDRLYGDASMQPNPNLAPLEKAPFYALPIYGGDIGTNGGISTDEKARALDANGVPIEGLYAVGNCAASVMGYSYPGAGSTLGPAMTFGFIAGRDAAGVADEDLSVRSHGAKAEKPSEVHH